MKLCAGAIHVWIVQSAENYSLAETRNLDISRDFNKRSSLPSHLTTTHSHNKDCYNKDCRFPTSLSNHHDVSPVVKPSQQQELLLLQCFNIPSNDSKQTSNNLSTSQGTFIKGTFITTDSKDVMPLVIPLQDSAIYTRNPLSRARFIATAIANHYYLPEHAKKSHPNKLYPNKPHPNSLKPHQSFSKPHQNLSDQPYFTTPSKNNSENNQKNIELEAREHNRTENRTENWTDNRIESRTENRIENWNKNPDPYKNSLKLPCSLQKSNPHPTKQPTNQSTHQSNHPSSIHSPYNRQKFYILAESNRNKPHFKNSSLKFSISHTSGILLIAYTLDKELGIDIEAMTRLFNIHPSNIKTPQNTSLKSTSNTSQKSTSNTSQKSTSKTSLKSTLSNTSLKNTSLAKTPTNHKSPKLSSKSPLAASVPKYTSSSLPPAVHHSSNLSHPIITRLLQLANRFFPPSEAKNFTTLAYNLHISTPLKSTPLMARIFKFFAPKIPLNPYSPTLDPHLSSRLIPLIEAFLLLWTTKEAYAKTCDKPLFKAMKQSQQSIAKKLTLLHFSLTHPFTELSHLLSKSPPLEDSTSLLSKNTTLPLPKNTIFPLSENTISPLSKNTPSSPPIVATNPTTTTKTTPNHHKTAIKQLPSEPSFNPPFIITIVIQKE